MIKNKFIFIIFFLVLSFFSNGKIFANEDIQTKYLFILNDNTDVYDNFNNNKSIKKLGIFDKVQIDKPEIKNNMIKIIKDNISGWVNADKTSYIPKDWYEEKRVDDFIIYYPSKYSFEFGMYRYKVNKRNNLLSEHKFNNNIYYIIVSKYNNEKLSEIINKLKDELYLKRNKSSNKIFTIGSKTYLYTTGISENESKKFHTFFIERDNNIVYQFEIFIWKGKYSINDEDIAKKIVFSAVLSDLKLFDNELTTNRATIKAKVTASDNLRMRKEPSLDSEKIVSIPVNETVEVIQQSEKQAEINGKTGKWIKIKWKTYEGWVFDAFLEYEK